MRSFLSAKWGKMLSGKLNRLVVSINAGTADTYHAQMRYKNEALHLRGHRRQYPGLPNGGDLHRRGPPSAIIFHMVANTGNFGEIGNLTRLAAEMRVPVVSVGNYICAQPQHLDKTLWNVKEEYNAVLAKARALGQELGVQVSGRQFFSHETEVMGAESCAAPFEQFFVETPGTTAPCCFMGRERMGNVYESGFEAVWFSDVMNKLRGERFMAPCKVCTVFTPFDSKVAHILRISCSTDEDGVLNNGDPAKRL